MVGISPITKSLSFEQALTHKEDAPLSQLPSPCVTDGSVCIKLTQSNVNEASKIFKTISMAV
jgi:hypothetical protein